MEKSKGFIKKYCPLTALVFFAFGLASFVVWIISENSEAFSNFFNRYIGSFFRGAMAMLTNLIPFSVAECIIISIPLLFIGAIALCVKFTRKGGAHAVRYIVTLASIAALLYGMFVMTTAVAYNSSTLDKKLGLEQEKVSVDELRETALYMIEKMDEELDSVKFRYGGSSVMPYSVSEMNDKLLEAYDTLADKHEFLPKLWSRIKQVSLSEAMTYTHMSGMYTYYTGEANLNVNFPDYNLPYTAAHELAHQRGVLPENEANFVAFLVCVESDDPYIRYSGYMNMYEYLNSALYSADYDTFAEVYGSLDSRAIYEMRAYNAFFEKYRENVAASVSSTLNDTYLKAQGQTAGEKSYGMVVDLAVAYYYALEK